MLSEGFVAAVLAGMEDTLDELIEGAPSETVRSELVELGDQIHNVRSESAFASGADGSNNAGVPTR